jgi:hypothetical protein
VKIWASILAAGAILAFAASASYSAVPWDTHSGPGDSTTRIPEEPRPLGKQVATIKALRAENKALAARVKALAAENKALKARLYTNLQSGSSGGCSDYMFCTHENDCHYWGINCGGAPDPASTGSRDYSVLECASSADPVQTIDYPASYDWSC